MRLGLALAVASLCLGCAHAGPAAPAAPAPTWPSPPEVARARWAGQLPPLAPAEKPSWWRRGLAAVLGTDARPDAAAAVLVRPFGVAVRGADVLVADPDRAALVRFEWPGGTWRPVECERRTWAGPIAVAYDGDGGAYVADVPAGEVVRVAADGRCTAVGAGALERPTGVAVSQGRVYVVDTPRHAIVAFDRDGREALHFGGRGEGDGQLNFPTAIAAADDGDLLVVDSLNFRVVRFSPDGRFRSKFGRAGDVEGTFGRPKGVAASEGRIFVTDAQYDVVLAFREGGEFRYLVGEPGSGPGQLTMPAGVAVGGGRLFVANSQLGRIDVYELLGGEP